MLVSERLEEHPPAEKLFAEIEERKLVPGVGKSVSLTDQLADLHGGPTADLVAAFLLRLLGSDYVHFETTQARVRVASFLDANYGPKLSQYYTPPKRRDARDTLGQLSGVAPALERRARELIEDLEDLARASIVRTELLRLINGEAGRVLFRPFLPERPPASIVKDVFEAATAFYSAGEKDVAASHGRLQSIAEGLRLDSKAIGTAYAALLFGRTAERLAEAARGSYEYQRPPARLKVVSRTKPLPLDEPGVTCTLSLAIENRGEAPANDVSVLVTDASNRVALPEKPSSIGSIQRGTEAVFEVPITVIVSSDTLELDVETRWTNLDQATGSARDHLAIAGQAAGLDWERLASVQPFAPYPVEDPKQLVGRDEELRRLVTQFSQPPLDNLFITGQRRVGKTSLVRALRASLRRMTESLVITQVELGEARHGGSNETIAALGRRLADRMVRAVGLQDEIPVGAFSDSLAPLIDVVEAIRDLDASLSFLFIIDEFDELPHEVYRRDGPGDALFLAIRSLAQKPYVGWILIGGESMPFIRDEQAHRLNTFTELDLGYLQQDGDFATLIQGPLPEGLVVDPPAIRAIHAESSGNPHFAKEIAANLFRSAVGRRDAVITAAEVEEAADVTAKQRDLELFAHFWEDGIFEVDDQRRRRELQRRVYLTALAELLRRGRSTSAVAVRQACDVTDFPDWTPARTEAEFARRQILIERSGEIVPTVPIFRRWLESEGVYKLPPRGLAEHASANIGRTSREAKVNSEEIGRLLDRWRDFQYQGQTIRRDDIESWLRQFETFVEQRLMFRLLERFRVVPDGRQRAALRQLQGAIQPKRPIQLERGQRSLAHVLVSYCGPMGGSGPAYAQLYRQAHNIRRRKVKERREIPATLRHDGEIQAVVLVDDFLGSGNTAVKALAEIIEGAPDLADLDIDWFVFAVVGLESGAVFIERSAVAQALGVRAEVADSIQAHDLPFHRQSSVFSDAKERALADETVRRYGERLWPEHPLGLSDGQALVVFPNNCPNNVPPIFWSDRDGWRPLFRRSAVN